MAFDWTPQRERELIRLFSQMLAKDVAQRMGCSINMVYGKAASLGFRKYTFDKRDWTNAECDQLISVYRTTSNAELEAMFNRPFKAIAQKARKLGVYKIAPAQAGFEAESVYEPDFDVQEQEIAPGHRVVRFGRRHRIGHGQTQRSQPRGVSSLWNLYG